MVVVLLRLGQEMAGVAKFDGIGQSFNVTATRVQPDAETSEIRVKLRSFLTPAAALCIGFLPALVQAQQAPASTTTPKMAPTATAPAADMAPATPQPAAAAHPMATNPEGAKRQQQVEQQLKSLHDKLKITPDQQSLWDAFAEARRSGADRDASLIQESGAAGQENALQMMQQFAKVTQSYAENAQTILPHFEALYNALTADQKKTADKIFAEHRKQMMQHANH
jgi:periplasmic protein CpxP/Spy